MPTLHDIVTKNSVDRSVSVHIMDRTDGTPETGVVFNTSGIDLWYRREGAAKTSITEVTLAALTTAHSDGGFLHVSDGDYRLDLPDAAFATGANYVDFGGAVTGMIVIGGRVRLIDANLEVANLDQAGVRTAVGLASANLDTQFGVIGGYLDTEIAAIKVKTDFLPSATAGAAGGVFIAGTNAATTITTGFTVNITGNVSGSVGSVTGAVGSVTAGVGLTAAAVDAIWDEPKAGHATAGTYGLYLDAAISGVSTGGVSAADIADAVLDEAMAGHVTAGTLGKAVADILVDTAEIGTAGAGLTALATQASVNTIDDLLDSEVAAIKAKTDQLAFTKTNELDVNVQSINGVTITGDGSATPFDV